MNLSKGRMGETNAQLIGSMLIVKIYLAAMSRADVSAEDMRKLPNFYFFVDEFQSFANETFADILSESRKYKLNLTIAHQYIFQMPEEVQKAVFGNVGTMVIFRVGVEDAAALETEFMPVFTPEDMVSLGAYQIYLKLMIDGISSKPFSATTLPPVPSVSESFKNEVIEYSRKTYSQPRSEVETAISARYVPKEPPKAPPREAVHGAGRPSGAPVALTRSQAPYQSSSRPSAPSFSSPRAFTPQDRGPRVAPSEAVRSHEVRTSPVSREPRPSEQAPRNEFSRPAESNRPHVPVDRGASRSHQPFKKVFNGTEERPKPVVVQEQRRDFSAGRPTPAPVSLKVLEQKNSKKPLENSQNLQGLKEALAEALGNKSKESGVKNKEENTITPKIQSSVNEPFKTTERGGKGVKEIPEDELRNMLKVEE